MCTIWHLRTTMRLLNYSLDFPADQLISKNVSPQHLSYITFQHCAVCKHSIRAATLLIHILLRSPKLECYIHSFQCIREKPALINSMNPEEPSAVQLVNNCYPVDCIGRYAASLEQCFAVFRFVHNAQVWLCFMWNTFRARVSSSSPMHYNIWRQEDFSLSKHRRRVELQILLRRLSVIWTADFLGHPQKPTVQRKPTQGLVHIYINRPQIQDSGPLAFVAPSKTYIENIEIY